MNNKKQIHSFDDLQLRIKELKDEIQDQEEAFNESPVAKIASTLRGERSFKSLLTHELSPKKIISSPALLNTLLLSNKFTRKYFVGFTVAKEMIPYTYHKISGFLKSKNKEDDNDEEDIILIDK